MVVKFHCILLITFMIYSVSSKNIPFNFNWPNNNKNIQSMTTLPPEKVHFNIHENGYSAEDKYKYINECVQKCMQNRQQQSNTKFSGDRDNCIQLQCRIYE